MGAFRTELVSGERFGPYEIVRALGRGGTASVFAARHLARDRVVALKVMHPHLAGDRQAAARFVQEGRLASKIRHPAVVDVHEVGTEAGTPYLVMEVLEGCDLATHLRSLSASGRSMGPEEALDVFLPIAAAVACAHDLGVIHRDLKPGNIWLSTDARGSVVPKVLDFGLSKSVADDPAASLTTTAMIVGTLHYMSPEQTRGAKHASAASDQYALGVILYECLTGRKPFAGEDAYALMEAVRSDPVASPMQVRPSIPEAIDAIVLRAMQREPALRFPSVRALATALLPFASPRTLDAWRRNFEPTRRIDRPSDPDLARLGSGVQPAATRASARPSAPPASASGSSFPSSFSSSNLPAAPVTSSLPAASSPSHPPLDPAPSYARVALLPVPPGESPFRIKGMAYRGLARYVRTRLPGGIAALHASLGDPRVSAFLEQTFLAASYYDVLPIVPLHAAMARVERVSLDAFSRAQARAQARYDAERVHKRLLDGAPREMPARIARLSALYYDFGISRVEDETPGEASLVRDDVPAYLLPWYSPMQEAYVATLLERSGASGVEVRARPPMPALRRGAFELVTLCLDMRWNPPASSHAPYGREGPGGH